MSFHSLNPAEIFLDYTVNDQLLSVPFAALDQFHIDGIRAGIIQGFGIGCGTILAFVSWCSISNKKTPVFVLNQICLLLMVFRSILYLAHLLGTFNSISYAFTGIFDNDWADFRVTIAVSTVYILLITSIEVLFVFQVYVMFKSCRNTLYKWAVIGFAVAIALVVFIMYVVETTFSLVSSRRNLMGEEGVSTHWRVNLPFILFCVSIISLSVLLLGKLMMAIRTRRVLGLKQFDALHVLLIMTLQTCIIPAAMAIYNYALTETSPIYVNLSVIIIVVNLPFSSLWASSANNSSVPNSCQNSVFSRVSSRESKETLAFSFRGNTLPKEDFSSANSEKGFDGGTPTADDDHTINRILQEIEMELRIRYSR